MSTILREALNACVTDNLDTAANERSEGKVSSDWLTGFCVAYERLLAALASEGQDSGEPNLLDPNVVHVNMLRGTIAKPSVEQILHLYPGLAAPSHNRESGDV